MTEANHKRQSVSEVELSAFADGQLPQAHSARVAAHLRANPEDADRIHAYWRQEAELYRAFSAGVDEQEFPPPAKTGRLPLYAVAAVVLVCAATAPLLLREGDPPQPASQVALQVSQQEPVSTYAGLELHPGTGQIPVEEDVVEYHFSSGAGVDLVLYEYATRGGAGAGYGTPQSGAARVEWIEAGRRFVLEGGRDAAELMSLAVSLRRQLSSPPPAATDSGDLLTAPPANGPAVQSIQEKELPSGVSKM